MRTEEVAIWSHGEQLQGRIHRPDRGGPFPVIIQGPGWLGSKCSRISELFHPGFTEAGFAVVTFDYRGWTTDSPRVVNPRTQVEDILAAVNFVGGEADLRADEIALWGLGGTGGGNAIIAGALEPRRVKATIAQTVVASGAEWLRSMRRPHEWSELLDRVRRNEIAMAHGGPDELVDPTQEIMVATPERLAVSQPTFGKTFGLSTVSNLLHYRPIDFVSDATPRGLLLTALDEDSVAPEAHAEKIYLRAGQPKALVRLRGVTHYDQYQVYRDELLEIFTDWIRLRFAEAAKGIEVIYEGSTPTTGAGAVLRPVNQTDATEPQESGH